jgi:hypothetical protein
LYNRYIPQPDGSYQRNRVSSPDVPQTQQPQELPEAPTLQKQRTQDMTAGSFLRRLIPKGLDTGDLLIIVLLLLMAGDCEEEKNTALLTLALYLFL